jgi:hypothetical protein
MRAYLLEHLKDAELRRCLFTWGSQERSSTAMFIAHIAEFDRRKLFVPEGYPSMFGYCVRELKLSEGGTYRRIRAARAARKFPTIFEALADGRLHLTAVVLVAPHLTRANHAELIQAAAYKNKSEIELLLAERFPRPDVAPRITTLPSSCVGSDAGSVTPKVETESPGPTQLRNASLTLASVENPMISHFSQPAVRPARVEPLSPKRFALQITIDQEFRDLLEEAKSLLSHSQPSGDVAEVLKDGLKRLVEDLRKRKCAETQAPRAPRRLASGSRTIPAHVRREVWKRDQGRCTFMSDSGHRCESRKLLEFDHVEPYARGGQATIDGVRLRCRAHNQYEAEQAFGSGFMEMKRKRCAGR